MTTLYALAKLVQRINHPEFAYLVGAGAAEGPWLRVGSRAPTCNVTGQPMGEPWYGRKWRLSYHMTDGEIVQTALMATLAAAEHEHREKFTVDGLSIFDPHYDLEKLLELRASGEAIKERDHV